MPCTLCVGRGSHSPGGTLHSSPMSSVGCDATIELRVFRPRARASPTVRRGPDQATLSSAHARNLQRPIPSNPIHPARSDRRWIRLDDRADGGVVDVAAMARLHRALPRDGRASRSRIRPSIVAHPDVIRSGPAFWCLAQTVVVCLRSLLLTLPSGCWASTYDCYMPCPTLHSSPQRLRF